MSALLAPRLIFLGVVAGRLFEYRGDNQKARDTLATLLTLWKNADSDLPTLVAAKSAYAKLQ
jgi:hypothetical protein